ncbi:MAG: DMT family transporter [Anaerolineae bacterium]|nr:DMT family transporter [Anaerolineae bacterium]
MLANVFLLLLSVFAASTAVIMIKASTTHPVVLASLRLFVAALVLLPLFVRDLRRYRGLYTRKHLAGSVLPGLVLAVHLMSWVVGARMTPTANASLIVNLVPLAMPFFLLWLAQEPLTRREALATAVALGGVVLLTASDLSLNPTYFAGDLISFGSMLFYALYMALGRRNRSFPSVWLYLVPLYGVAAVSSMAVALFFVNPIQPYSAREGALILGLGIVPTVIGHSLLNRAMRTFRGQIVSIVNMGQFVFAGLMAYVLWREVPHWPFYVASVLLACSAWMVVSGSLQRSGPADRL